MSFFIVSGLSGSGKTIALQALEDIGFYCIDNLPAALLAHFAGLLADKRDHTVANDDLHLRAEEIIMGMLEVARGEPPVRHEQGAGFIQEWHTAWIATPHPYQYQTHRARRA